MPHVSADDRQVRYLNPGAGTLFFLKREAPLPPRDRARDSIAYIFTTKVPTLTHGIPAQ